MQNEYKGISKITADCLKTGENEFIEFKRDVNGLEVDDIVAFANSEHGGTIIIGVKEEKEQNGRQIGTITGVEPSDSNKLKIENKINNCFPKIDAKIVIENLNYKPIFRIEIISGSNKPYCSQKGTYTIRGNARNIPLLPVELLQIYLLNESESFLNRFKNSTKQFSDTLNDLSENIESTLNGIEYDLAHIREVSSTAAENSDENFGLTDSIYGISQEIYEKIEKLDNDHFLIDENILEILDHFSIEEPRVRRKRKSIFYLISRMKEDGKSKEEIIENLTDRYDGFDKKSITEIYELYEKSDN